MQNDLISRSERLRQIRQTEPADCGSAMLISDAKKMIRAFIEEAPAVDAVPVGRMGDGHLEEEALHWGVVTDADGGRWVPVYEAVLLELIEKAKANDPESMRPKGRWIDTGESYEDEHCRYNYWACSVCENRIAGRYGLHNYCPNCGAKMEG